jgi:hypothetical protein
MQKHDILFNGYPITLTIHEYDGEIEEIFADWNGMEIGSAIDMISMFEELSAFFRSSEAFAKQFFAGQV